GGLRQGDLGHRELGRRPGPLRGGAQGRLRSGRALGLIGWLGPVPLGPVLLGPPRSAGCGWPLSWAGRWGHTVALSPRRDASVPPITLSGCRPGPAMPGGAARARCAGAAGALCPVQAGARAARWQAPPRAPLDLSDDAAGTTPPIEWSRE